MGDWWFDIATSKHFWVRRRFEVLKRLAGSLIEGSRRIAEIGCGNGLLQRDIEDHYGLPVAGFDLNELALQKNVSRTSPLYCYDINQQHPNLRSQFDLLFLFDVLEHIDDEAKFLESVRFHLADSGSLLVNVPAHQALYSNYDRAAGHVRRYAAKQLVQVAARSGLKVRAITYWGFPLLPLLLLRKAVCVNPMDGKVGFDTRGPITNSVLSLLARCEHLPQTLMGTSVMAVLERA
jgi:SAM-dependent methyltransferase